MKVKAYRLAGAGRIPQGFVLRRVLDVFRPLWIPLWGQTRGGRLIVGAAHSEFTIHPTETMRVMTGPIEQVGRRC